MSRIPGHRGLAVLCLLCLAACDIHELPVGSSDVAVTLHLDFDRDLPPYTTVEYPRTRSEGEDALQVRYELRLYKGVPGDFERTPFYSDAYLTDYDGTLGGDVQFRFPARPGRYLAQLWVDFVSAEHGPFYDVDNFRDIRLSGEYTGEDERRDAYCLQAELPLETLITAGSEYETTLTLGRPLARYRFVATDKEEFLSFWAREIALMSGNSVKPTLSERELDRYGVRVVYSQYLPDAFNMFTDRASDAGTGYSFQTNMHLREDGKVDLAWDWVIVGPDEGLVVVSLEFYDPDGRYIATFRNFELPLMRGHVTTVEGKILTGGVDSGIAIDPTFDGEFNVYL